MNTPPSSPQRYAHASHNATQGTAGQNLPQPFIVNAAPMSPYAVATQCHLSVKAYKKQNNAFIRVSLYYNNLKIMQNDYDLNLQEIAKL